MKYLLFNWDYVNDIGDPSELTNEEFENIAKIHGQVFGSCEDFESGFNAELFSTHTHQLRIIKS